jgi:hypothetical protein
MLKKKGNGIYDVAKDVDVCHTLARGCEKKNGYMLPQKIMISICDS